MLRQNLQPVHRQLTHHNRPMQQRHRLDFSAGAWHHDHYGLAAAEQIRELKITWLDMNPGSRRYPQQANVHLALE